MQKPQKKFHLRKNDIVFVLTGKDRGKRGKILHIDRKKTRAVVEKINFIKRHTRKTPKNPQGGIIEKEAPVHISNLMLICSKCDRPVRTRYKYLDDGRKVRTCFKCGEAI
jgi:large subunit ribosomal protein L24